MHERINVQPLDGRNAADVVLGGSSQKWTAPNVKEPRGVTSGSKGA